MLHYAMASASIGAPIAPKHTQLITRYLKGYSAIDDVLGHQQTLIFDGIQDSWIPYMSPVINQGNCANCWAVSSVDAFTGLANKYIPAEHKAYYAAEQGDPDGKIILSVDQMTQCTSVSFYK